MAVALVFLSLAALKLLQPTDSAHHCSNLWRKVWPQNRATVTFPVVMLTFPVIMLTFPVIMLAFTVGMLAFTADMLAYTAAMLTHKGATDEKG